jgi:hypothetical protein
LAAVVGNSVAANNEPAEKWQNAVVVSPQVQPPAASTEASATLEAARAVAAAIVESPDASIILMSSREHQQPDPMLGDVNSADDDSSSSSLCSENRFAGPIDLDDFDEQGNLTKVDLSQASRARSPAAAAPVVDANFAGQNCLLPWVDCSTSTMQNVSAPDPPEGSGNDDDDDLSDDKSAKEKAGSGSDSTQCAVPTAEEGVPPSFCENVQPELSVFDNVAGGGNVFRGVSERENEECLSLPAFEDVVERQPILEDTSSVGEWSSGFQNNHYFRDGGECLSDIDPVDTSMESGASGALADEAALYGYDELNDSAEVSREIKHSGDPAPSPASNETPKVTNPCWSSSKTITAWDESGDPFLHPSSSSPPITNENVLDESSASDTSGSLSVASPADAEVFDIVRDLRRSERLRNTSRCPSPGASPVPSRASRGEANEPDTTTSSKCKSPNSNSTSSTASSSHGHDHAADDCSLMGSTFTNDATVKAGVGRSSVLRNKLVDQGEDISLVGSTFPSDIAAGALLATELTELSPSHCGCGRVPVEREYPWDDLCLTQQSVTTGNDEFLKDHLLEKAWIGLHVSIAELSRVVESAQIDDVSILSVDPVDSEGVIDEIYEPYELDPLWNASTGSFHEKWKSLLGPVPLDHVPESLSVEVFLDCCGGVTQPSNPGSSFTTREEYLPAFSSQRAADECTQQGSETATETTAGYEPDVSSSYSTFDESRTEDKQQWSKPREEHVVKAVWNQYPTNAPTHHGTKSSVLWSDSCSGFPNMFNSSGLCFVDKSLDSNNEHEI